MVALQWPIQMEVLVAVSHNYGRGQNDPPHLDARCDISDAI